MFNDFKDANEFERLVLQLTDKDNYCVRNITNHGVDVTFDVESGRASNLYWQLENILSLAKQCRAEGFNADVLVEDGSVCWSRDEDKGVAAPTLIEIVDQFDSLTVRIQYKEQFYDVVIVTDGDDNFLDLLVRDKQGNLLTNESELAKTLTGAAALFLSKSC
jgi:hypothetical protein